MPIITGTGTAAAVITAAMTAGYALVRDEPAVQAALSGIGPVTIGLMLLHNLIDFVAKLVRGAPGHDSTHTVPRMNLHFRISHAMMATGIDGLTLNLPANGHNTDRIHLLGELGLAATA